MNAPFALPPESAALPGLPADGAAAAAVYAERCAARALLHISGDLPLHEAVDELQAFAEQSGLGSPANLRQHFQRVLRTSPNSYRRAFKATVG